MQHWKRGSALSAMVALTVALAACTGGTGTPSEPEPQQPSPQTESPSPEGTDEETYTVTILDYRYGALPPRDGEGLKMIEERFNIKYEPTYVGVDDYKQRVSVTVAGGSMPDILVLENPQDPLYYQWAKQGAFLPLNEFLDDPQYGNLQLIPDHAKRALEVDGVIYGIPGYTTSTYSITPMIRVDWLENLGLEMPTNYDELREVALAFTHNDPNRSNKNDTYGMAMAENINPQYHLGAYWDFLAWYHRDAQGNLIPGIISDVRRDHIAWLKDLYEQGAITTDFALMNWGQAYNEFFSGKAGMFITTPRGLGEQHFQALAEIDPDAKLAPIPPFEAPDGSRGFSATSGTLRLIMLNANLKDEPGKVKRIIEMIDYGRTFVEDNKGPDNPDYDWLYGREGSGYNVVDGNVVVEPGEKGLKPRDYLPDLQSWAPNDAAGDFPSNWRHVPKQYELALASAEMHDTTEHYYSPVLSIYSPARSQNELQLFFDMYAIQTRMITGQTPLEEWDSMVETYMNSGGEEMIAEVNRLIQEAGVEPYWE
ncbi:extracellular solute-binding protein [Paenibacillus senegalensis]|uniref:extracellular solute-binding protein n=1 Tax=Paenibacillus senegalensis TaxID=1465766 RepID=UPI0004753F49|nr:extracellular solute-binding protein [Paenibacillus senegalensis]